MCQIIVVVFLSCLFYKIVLYDDIWLEIRRPTYSTVHYLKYSFRLTQSLLLLLLLYLLCEFLLCKCVCGIS